jgi:chloramphenicol-sensitive protein RarD
MKESRPLRSGVYILAAFLAAGIWGFFSIPLRSLRGYASEDILSFRILVSMLVLLLVQILVNRKRVKKDWQTFRALPRKEARNWIWISLMASILITANWYSFIFVINQVNIQSGAFAYIVCPLLTALAAYLILKEKITTLQKWALVLALFAVILLSTRYFHDVLWSIFVAIWYALYLVIQKISPPIEKGIFLTVQLVISFLFILPYFFLSKPHFPSDFNFWLVILLIAVVFTIIPLYLSLFSLESISSTTMGIILYFNPLVSFCVAIFYFHESVNFFKMTAYFMVLLAVILFNGAYFTRLRKTEPAS